MTPAARAFLLVQCPHRAADASDLPFAAERVTFPASDGVRLAGWLVTDPAAQGTVILVHGFKSTRAEMVGRAAFLHAAHYAVLLYDSRGCGESGGTFGVGATEDRDIIGAARFVASRGGPAGQHIAVFGLSLGAGDALLAAGEAPRSIDAVIADSAWADERVQLEHMSAVRLEGWSVPLLPYGPRLVDALIGSRLDDARPRDAIAKIAPHPILFIHCGDDRNATTPLSGVQAMYETPVNGKRIELFVFRGCGHAGAFGADPATYQKVVLLHLSQAFH